MMKVIDPTLHNAELEKWRDAKSILWMYHASLRRMAIRLFGAAEIGDLYIVAVGCTHIVGPFAWDSSNISIVSLHNETGGLTYKIVDSQVGFELCCSSVILAIAPYATYYESFGDLFE